MSQTLQSASVANSSAMISSRGTIIFTLLLLAVFFARSFYTALPEMHDARKKWQVASEIAKSNDLTHILALDHHSSRWGVILPTALAIKLNGRSLQTYYSITLALYAALFCMLVLFATNELGRGLIFLFAVLLFYEPMFFRASSQLQPFVFGVFYLTLSLWALSRFINSHHLGYLALGAIFAFCAYGSKETYLFFFPGLFLLLWWRANIQACVYFALFLLALLLLETVAFNMLSQDLTFGRIEFLQSGKHLSKMSRDLQAPNAEFILSQWQALSVADQIKELVLRRWLMLPPLNLFMVFVSVVYIAYLAISGKYKTLGNASLGMVLMVLSYSILISIAPSSINPLIPLQPLREKYLTALMPYYVFISILTVGSLIHGCFSNHRQKIIIGINILAAVFVIYALMLGSPFTYRFKTDLYPQTNLVFWKYPDLPKALNNKIGICAHRSAPLVKIKTILSRYIYQQGQREDLKLARLPGHRVLHLRRFKTSDLTGYLYHETLFTEPPQETCKAKG